MDTRIRLVRFVDLNVIRLPSGSFVDSDDASRYLGVTRSTLNRWIKDGRIKAERDEGSVGRNGYRWLVPTSELNRLRKAR